MKKNGIIAITCFIAAFLMYSCSGPDFDSKSSPARKISAQVLVGDLIPCGKTPGKVTYTVYTMDGTGKLGPKYKDLDPYRKRYSDGFTIGALESKDIEVPSSGAWALVAEVETDCSSCVNAFGGCANNANASTFFRGMITFGFGGAGQANSGSTYTISTFYDGKICCN